MSIKSKKYMNQDFERLRKECFENEKQWKDPTFPANKASLGHGLCSRQAFSWKRPSELCQNPQFVVDRIVPNDIDQGTLGDCWFLSAVAAVASVPEYIDQVVPPAQNFEQNSGIFMFRFWRFGQWLEVCVDDRLPVDEHGRLAFAKNRQDPNEFFAALLEKAYAKVNSCYAFLIGGDIMDALTDMTGGVFERLDMNKRERNELWETLYKAYQLKSLLGSSIEGSGRRAESELPNGLITSHAYTILDLCELQMSIGSNKFDERRGDFSNDEETDKSVRLIRIRNPWGNKVPYTGPWSAQSDKWEKVTDRLREELGAQNQTDGQFYMSYQDWLREFNSLDVMHVNMSAYGGGDDQDKVYKWVNKEFEGEWNKGNAGGCGNGNRRDYWRNPQFHVELTLANSDDNKISSILSLMQSDQVKKRVKTRGGYKNSMEAMGLAVFKVKEQYENKFGGKRRFKERELDRIFRSEPYLAARTITQAISLTPGKYIIIPSTFKKNGFSRFLLRIYMEGANAENVNMKSLGISIGKQRKPRPPPVEDNAPPAAPVPRPFFYDEEGEDVEEGDCEADDSSFYFYGDMDMSDGEGYYEDEADSEDEFKNGRFRFYDDLDQDEDEEEEEEEEDGVPKYDYYNRTTFYNDIHEDEGGNATRACSLM